MAKHNIKFSKGLGQNFLVNPSVCPKMAESALPDNNYCALEIGAGVGVLTVELAKRAKKVVSIEIDQRLVPLLEESTGEYNNIEFINEDVLKIDLNRLMEDEFSGEKVCVCANLPYYITSPVIMKILESKISVEALILMVQKEVAQRICAKPSSKDIGAITISTLFYAKPKILFNVSKGSFIPQPKVSSSVIRLDIRKEYPCDEKVELVFKKVVKFTFAQRRKTILNSLSSGFGIDKSIVENILNSLGISPSLRAEQLQFDDFINIARCFEEYDKNG